MWLQNVLITISNLMQAGQYQFTPIQYTAANWCEHTIQAR